jgi:hypothetical protein
MPHRLHLCLLADNDSSRVQVCTSAHHWMWPIVEVGGRTRLPLAGARHLGSAVKHCAPCCVTYPAVSEGPTVDWLGVYVVDHASLLPRHNWTSLSDLDRASAVVSYQGDAMDWYRAGMDGSRSAGPFEAPEGLDIVRRWVGEHLGERDTLLNRCTPYRLTAHEAVLAFDAVPTRVYFKAHGTRPFRDALVSQLLDRLVPGAAPRTLAWDARRGWWLLDHVEGLTMEPRWDVATAIRVIDAVAEIQEALRPHTADLLATGVEAITDQLLEAQLHEILRLAEGEAEFPVREVIEDFTCARAVLADDDRTWNHNDLAPQNIGVSERGVAFIDHETAALGPAFISVPKLARTCRLATRAPEDWPTVCARRLSRSARPSASDDSTRQAQATAAAVAVLAVQIANLRRREANGECASSLGALGVHAARRMVHRLRERAPS